jgi:hypothetical protein
MLHGLLPIHHITKVVADCPKIPLWTLMLFITPYTPTQYTFLIVCLPPQNHREKSDASGRCYVPNAIYCLPK